MTDPGSSPSERARSIVATLVPGSAKRGLDALRARAVMSVVGPANEEFARRHGLTVTGGPFAGLRYPPGLERSQGDQVAKLLGRYEAELHEAVEAWRAAELGVIVNIGCAEGYYAVGLALMLPAARVLAYDIDPLAQRRCAQLAAHNGVAERVSVGGECSRETLRSLPEDRVAVVCDCEGCELGLLDPEAVPQLVHWPMVVELHDFVEPSITETIVARFSSSHEVRLIDSRPPGSAPAELSFLGPRRRSIVLSERRPAQMRWAVMTPRSAPAPSPPASP